MWIVGSFGGCGVRLMDGWAGRTVIRQHVPVPVDALWSGLVHRAGEIGLVIAKIRPDHHTIEFDWVTVPGDGRLYLRCRESGPVGSASLKPRIVIEATGGGSSLVIESQVRATTSATCESTGRFEDWLLKRFEPAILATLEGAGSPPVPAKP